jgi:DNA helicase-2/ATP-dependent DNA helicase PcrA
MRRSAGAKGVVDFAELLLRSYELLQRNEPLCQHYQARFRHILVDEFQDTNRLQYAWLKLLAGRGSVIPESAAACLFAVGDDDQSIYAFRGAEIGNMRDLQREFALPNVIRLEQNYRSHGNILDAANALIKQNRGRLGKNYGPKPALANRSVSFEAYSDVDEARFIVDELSELVREGVGRHQIALLYRSNAQSRVLEHHLFTQGMPYRVHGGLRFFDRQEIKHALAYLRLIANPDDDTAFAGWSIFRRAGSAVAASRRCRKRRSRPIPASTTRPRALPARPGARSPDSFALIETCAAKPAIFPCRSDRSRDRQERPAPALSGRQGRPGPTREPRRTDQRGSRFLHEERAPIE